MNFLQNANYIKSLVIDLLLRKVPKSLLGSEVKFGKNGTFADLLCLCNEKIYSYEIKANNDDLRNIKQQLTCYKSVFDYVYLVITEKHFKVAKHRLGSSVGLIIINSSKKIEIYREATIIKRRSKEELLYSMTKKYLEEYYGLSKLTAYQVRSILEDKKLQDLKKAYYNFLIKKLNPKNKLFNSETGIRTHFEDISLLSYSENSQLL